jgi:3-hydroxyisobutyrate dehydrogenase-like beta-hydroxyacid dehydrogenase
MGSALAAALARGGSRVVSTIAGRSDRTARLADRAGLELLPDLSALVREADVVLSVVPPEAAESVVADISASARSQDVQPVVADLNAVSPATARRMAALAAAAACDFVDGSISGPPPWTPGMTRLYLSGPRATEIAELPFDGVDRIVVGDDIGAASAVKMSTASVYKGGSALLLQALLAAQANGVLEHVLGDLRTAAPELVADVERRLSSAAAKSGRYVAEMREIAETQAAAGLTPGLFEAMAELYASVAGTELAQRAPEDPASGLSTSDVLAALRRREPAS